ncbi:DUF3306 domain-containing protein [Sedimentitalea todarodis]|uniref:DUF3306 domain-containing protein n=1 Tax=Sedimentitalea todarodis TaxID=1631240 RepID=A0ABU3VEJ9_9RHOB|nr:DUF3306 domain-containing protein [Sedimentitalea todarodis]MDU9004605.1 DUF3306 domain-containing protein [Sedimentitalea todarodis]
MTGDRDFWSRRRAAVEAEAGADTEAEFESKRAALEAREDVEILQELNLPDPDTLSADDNISAFMDHLVPDRLRRRALRRFWRLNPVLANVDGLVDYGEDFTDSATVIENLQSAYQVGKGMLSHIETMAAEAAREEPEAIPEPIEEIDIAAEAAHAADTGEEAVPTGDPEETVAQPAPHRMRFDFPQETASERA